MKWDDLQIVGWTNMMLDQQITLYQYNDKNFNYTSE